MDVNELIVMWDEFESEYREWRHKKDNVFERDFEDLTIHDFIKWLRYKGNKK
jgi:hypothetical protein